MFSYRITKYNPASRDSFGFYEKNEWTSISDIGHIYNGKKFLKSNYFIIENAYVNSIIIFMDFLNIGYLIASNVEKHSQRPNRKRYCSLPMQNIYKIIETGSQLNKPQVKDVARLVLRELFWCKLDNSNNMFVHFGYDYYMYIGGSKKLPQNLRNKIENMGLFVEDFDF